MIRTKIILLAIAISFSFFGCNKVEKEQTGKLTFDVTCDTREFAGPEFQDSTYFIGTLAAINKIGKGEFMVSPGDIDPPWHIYNSIDSVLGKDYFWYPVIGNHESETPEDMVYLRNYLSKDMPNVTRRGPVNAEETFYSFEYGNVHFSVINQYYDGESDVALDGDMSEPTLAWLEKDLKENTKPVVFVVGHEPIVSLPDYENGRHRHKGDNLDKYPENSIKFQNLLREYNVRAYFCGHTHNFSIAKLNDIWQIDAGHARGIGDAGSRSTFLQLHVEGENITVDVYRSKENWKDYELTNTIVID
ncbi:MAG: metallophosphoesterase [Melioribacteraceae bacterium]|nr:metallophosphoesterase [Melioribacteraceae bacterium]MCF8355580.1 metallophosphoesterase [Melioribacteraceae bacterium]MCF8395041.1 metallophosphoesterase [Melioribacteraceae bacterium]MCF8420495.1 metallophosphoesterase [Melioribacteraceae bacterium]